MLSPRQLTIQNSQVQKMDAEESINEKTFSVKRQFQSSLNTLEHHNEAESQYLLRTTAEDLLARFLLWAGNMGALQRPTSKLSLDHRLSNASDVKHAIMGQLTDIYEALGDLSVMVLNGHDDHDVDIQSGLNSDLADQYSIVLQMISGCIGSLFKIGILVRKSTVRDRFQRALQESNLEFPPHFDIQHVQERYPKTIHSGLAIRLGSAIAKRRQFIAYCRDHRCRLGEESALEDGEKSLKERCSSKATTFHPDIESKDIQTEEDDAASFVSASTITDSDHAPQLPSLASLSPDGESFECPICFTLQKLEKETSWRIHVFRDLKAYVCTLGGSECDDLFFQDRKSWFDHEMTMHRATYNCPLCDHVKAVPKSDLQAHLISHGTFNCRQLQDLVQAGLHTANRILARHCPFCQEWATKLGLRSSRVNIDGNAALVTLSRFKRHVATHQEQLALFAVPQLENNYDIEDEDSFFDSTSSNASQADSATIEQGTQLGEINFLATEQHGNVGSSQPELTWSEIETEPPVFQAYDSGWKAPDEGESHRCECGKFFDTARDLRKHQRYHQKCVPCRFSGCDKAFSTQRDMARHMRTHRKGEGYQCKIDGCRKAMSGHVFSRKDSLDRHMRVAHPEVPHA